MTKVVYRFSKFEIFMFVRVLLNFVSFGYLSCFLIAILVPIAIASMSIKAPALAKSSGLPPARPQLDEDPMSSYWTLTRKIDSDGRSICNLSIQRNSRRSNSNFTVKFLFKNGFTTGVKMTYAISPPYHIGRFVLGVDSNRFASLNMIYAGKGTIQTRPPSTEEDLLGKLIIGYLSNPESLKLKIEIDGQIFEASIRGWHSIKDKFDACREATTPR